ncbi:wd40 protein ciao1 [Anaeramoeba ignava]|uniref:Probable cytosolic iron-sulfur protein assembly protein CIAO1 homolog n=1 Tax=Anaeramoeba ignava TaxID=1746090 RepID=A0A9Q0RGE6_ANAIG|nr:wd40 protein ciao1 [Anaeramoeba ignava]
MLRTLQTFPLHKDSAWDLAWNHQKNILASCSSDKTIRIFKEQMNQKTKKNEWICSSILEESHEKTIRSVDWSLDGKYLASCSFDGIVNVWKYSLKNGQNDFECIASLEGHANEVKRVKWIFSTESKNLLATCGRDKTIWIWEQINETEYECLAVLTGHSGDVKYISWMNDSKFLISSSYDETVKVWQKSKDENHWLSLDTLAGHNSTIWCCKPCGNNCILSCDQDNKIILWKPKTDIETLPEQKFLSGYSLFEEDSEKTEKNKIWQKFVVISNAHKRPIYSLEIIEPLTESNSELIFLTGSGDNSICIFSVIDSEVKIRSRYENAHPNDVNCVLYLKEKEMITSCCEDGIIKFWNFKK